MCQAAVIVLCDAADFSGDCSNKEYYDIHAVSTQYIVYGGRDALAKSEISARFGQVVEGGKWKGNTAQDFPRSTSGIISYSVPGEGSTQIAIR